MNEKWHFCNAVGDVIDLSVQETAGKLKAGKKMQEPDFTAALTTRLPKHLAAIRPFFMRGWHFGGCFIHQKPKVEFLVNGASEKREAGDLLVLLHETVDGKERFNATLFQLKMAQPDYHDVKPDNIEQLYLYTAWPTFSFVQQNAPQAYDIQPKVVTPGAQYMFVNEYLHPLITHTMPETVMSNEPYLCFEHFIWDFTHWQTGRPISDEQNKQNDEWSRFIWDLIDNTRQACFARNNVSMPHQPRTNGDFFNYLLSNTPAYVQVNFADNSDGGTETKDEGHDNAGNNEKGDKENSSNGISILLIDNGRQKTI